ncbi:hypothetical protein ACFYVR_26725 [Rhodococcus sp. NPDC003318]|uniref:hypothetical protein n=1 Tax=Rhodococcus sp. NPDC003318 TaxID=3364503 RepID=UPI00368BFB16
MTNTDRTVDEVGEADLLDQQRDADDVDDPGLDALAPQVTAGWDASEADRLDQVLTAPLDDERRT